MRSYINFLDRILRNGGYYNKWYFHYEMILYFLKALPNLEVIFLEIGFRSLKNDSFKGGCAYSTDTFLKSINLPSSLKDKKCQL